MGLVKVVFSVSMLAQTIRISTPYVFAALGGVFSERGGIVNVALEGIMLQGAFCAVVGAYYTGNGWVGVLAAIIGGALMALIHGIVSIKYRTNQIISGIALNLLAVGLTKFFLKLIFQSSSNSSRIEGIPSIKLPLVSSIPIVNLFLEYPLILLALVSVILSQIAIFRTKFGLHLRAVGENPEAACTLGINVFRTRYLGVILSGVLAGLGGAWLTLDQHQFTDGISGGRGFIALAAMIFGRWNPTGASLACLLFGFADALQLQLQSIGTTIPTQFVQMIPYLVTMIALAGGIGRAIPPAADGVPYVKE